MTRLRLCYRKVKPKSHCEENPITIQDHSYYKSLKLRSSVILTIILLACSQLGFGQASFGDYGTIASGNWDDVNVWGQWDGSSFVIEDGSYPVEGKNVFILAGFTINVNGAFEAQTVTVYSGGVLNLTPTTLTVGNPLYSNGLFNNYGTVKVINTSAILVNGSANLGNSAGGKLTIEAGGTLKTTGLVTLGSPGCLVLQSSANKTSSFTFESISSTNGGTAKVERFMSLSNNWHIYSSPVTGQSIFDFLKYNVDIPDSIEGGVYKGSAMREYFTDPGKWSGNFMYGGLPAGDVISGKGYSIRTYNDTQSLGTVDATGIPTNSNLDVPLTPASTTINGWNCIGNPYTNAISVGTPLSTTGFLNNSNKLKLDQNYLAIYLWDSSSGVYRASNWIVSPFTRNFSSVQLGQGFFVKSNTTGGNITFTKSMISVNQGTAFKSADPIVIDWPSIHISIKSKTSNSFTDIMLVTNTTKGLDPGYDAGLLTATPDFSLYSKLLEDNGTNFMLQCLPDQNYDQYVIPLGLDCKAGGDVTFTAETVNLPSGCLALLEDRLTKRFTRLDLKDAKYTATLNPDTKGIGRFFLHTSDVISGVQPLENQPYKVTAISNIVTITGEVSEAAQFYLYSVNGKQLANFKAESLVQNQFDASGYPAGVYILTVADKSQRKSVKFVIEK